MPSTTDGDTNKDEEELMAAVQSGRMNFQGEARNSDNPIYLLPLTDKEEFQRLDKQGLLLTLAMWSLVPLRNDIEETLKATDSDQGQKGALDVGCGPGQWTISTATVHPHARVVGIDQAPQMPSELPPNVEFQLHDVNQGLQPYYGLFDIVHARFIGGGITSYQALVQEVAKCLKPGGLAVFFEGNFDLVKEDQDTVQEPASDENPNGSWMQRWLQAVRAAQVRRCGVKDSDDSPETLDKGLWRFESYDPSSCCAASIFTPITPWPQSPLEEEALHFTVTGTLMRQNLKMFLSATEQLLVEDGHTKAQLAEWKSHIRTEMEGEGLFKLWYAWRVAWGRTPKATTTTESPHASTTSPTSAHGLVLPSDKQVEAGKQLMSKLPQFTLPQCVIRNQQESLAFVEHRNAQPFSTRGRF